MKTTLKEFNTSLSKLKADLREDKELFQNHFGDFCMIEEEENNEGYKVWLNHAENVAQGMPQWEIEYSGKYNNWVWRTIVKG